MISRRTLLLIPLTLGALLGNYFHLPLFYGVDFLFGSIFVLLTLLLQGRVWAILVALIGNSYTYCLWGHPYAIVLFTLEIVWLSWIAKRNRNWELPLWDAGYWLIVGIPLIWLFYVVLMPISGVSAGLVALKQLLNGVFNALVATQIFYWLPYRFLARIVQNTQEKEVTIRQLISNLFIVLVAVVTIGFTIWEGYSVKSRIEQNLAQNLQRISQTLNSQTEIWLNRQQSALEQLAQQPNLSAEQLNLFQQSHFDLEQVYLTNQEGIIVNASPPIETDNRVDVSQKAIFQKLQDSQIKTVSQIHRDRANPFAHFNIAVPISSQNTFSGIVAAELKIAPLKQQLEQIINNWSVLEENNQWQQLQFTVADGQGKVLFSNKPELELGETLQQQHGAGTEVSNRVRLNLPANASELPKMSQWQQSTYIFQQSFPNNLGWQLRLALPATDTVQAVQENYIRHLLAALAVMAVSLGTAPLVSSWLSTPLQDIAEKTTNLPHKLKLLEPTTFPDSRVKEIRQLATNSQTMANQLTTQFQQIQANQQQLEHQVQTRTQQLQQALSSLSDELTRRQEIAQKLAQSEAQFRSLVENAPLPIAMADSQGRLMFVNPAFIQVLGYPLAEILQHHISEYIHPEDFAREKPLFDELVAGTRNYYQIEERLLTKYEGWVWVSLTASPNFDQDGNFAYAIAMFENIGIKKRYEQQLELTNTELEQANQLKDEFLATMSHELRTPLNSVLGMTEALQEEVYGTLNPRQRQCLNTVQTSGNRLLFLINDILDLSNLEAANIRLRSRPISISRLCRTAIALVQESADEKRIAVNTEIAAQLPNLEGDEERLQQALIHLLANAIKFTPEQGHIALKATLINQGTAVAFSVVDTGIGIAEENLAKIFEPFRQLDSKLNRQKGGSGIGLSIVKHIAQLHGGDITVNSTPGEGSCFALTVPYSHHPLQLGTLEHCERH